MFGERTFDATVNPAKGVELKGDEMQLGMVGLGRMGANMVRRLMRGGHECVVWDLSPVNVKQLAREKSGRRRHGR